MSRSRTTVAALIGAAAPIVLALLAKLPSSAPHPANTVAPPQPAATAPAPPQAVIFPAAGAPGAPVAPTGTVTPPDPKCLARFADVGLPGEGDARGRPVICRQGYVLAYDPVTRDPDWVMERLNPADLTGPASRSNQFQHDPALPQGEDASDADYARSGFDRGHQAPAGDAKFSQAVMDQSFYFSNMAPQVGIGFNRGAWAYLEESIRAWVSCGGHSDLYVITGPIYPSGANPKTIGADKVIVPASFYKIVYDAVSGRAVGFVLPNTKIGSTIPDLQKYVQAISAIETDTGLTFFPAMDPRKQTQLKGQIGTAWGHIGTCPGQSSSD